VGREGKPEVIAILPANVEQTRWEWAYVLVEGKSQPIGMARSGVRILTDNHGLDVPGRGVKCPQNFLWPGGEKRFLSRMSVQCGPYLRQQGEALLTQ
jgi:hypothetical protein